MVQLDPRADGAGPVGVDHARAGVAVEHRARAAASAPPRDPRLRQVAAWIAYPRAGNAIKFEYLAKIAGNGLLSEIKIEATMKCSSCDAP